MTTTVPDYEQAAIKATETLIKNRISFAPVDPLPILKSTKNVLVLSFAELALKSGIDRKSVINTFSAEGQDATTIVKQVNGKIRYLVAYNQRLPYYLLQRALARELGHIILGHDGTRPEDVRTAEAICFAQHFLCPRALIHAIEDAGILITVEVVGNVTGCYERCLTRMRHSPGVQVPAEMNRKIREQFADYVENYASMQSILQSDDDSVLADFGCYMEGYYE